MRYSRLAVFHLEGGKSLAQKLTSLGINSNCNESRVFSHGGILQGRRVKSTALRSNRAAVNEFYLLDVLNTWPRLTGSFLTLGNISCDVKIEVAHATSQKLLKLRPQHLLKYDSWKVGCTLILLWIKSWVSSEFFIKQKFQFHTNISQ